MAEKIGSYKKKVWAIVAKYIKARDANHEGIARCCTCNKEFKYNDPQLHAGHFVPGRTNNIIFDDSIIHAQCYKCNIWGHGEGARYVLFMKKKYGYSDEDIEDILHRKHIIKKFTLESLKEIKEQFESLLTIELQRLNLASNKGEVNVGKNKTIRVLRPAHTNQYFT